MAGRTCRETEDRRMELRQVFVALGKRWSAQEERLKEQLLAEGIRYDCLSGGRINEMERPEMSDEADTVVITDDRALAAALAARGIVCIGCDDEEEGTFFEGAQLVTDAPESLDARTLEECLLRATARPMTIAETDRLILREIAEQDFDELYRISLQEEAQGVREDAYCFAPERLAAYIKHVYRLYGYGLWSVLLRDGTLLGCCGFADYTDRHAGREGSEEHKEFAGIEAEEPQELREPEERGGCVRENSGLPLCLELQYIVAEEYRRQGYGEEMCRAALAYAYGRLHADEIWVRVKTNNRVSQALAGKLGFTRIYTDSAGIAYFRKLREAL